MRNNMVKNPVKVEPHTNVPLVLLLGVSLVLSAFASAATAQSASTEALPEKPSGILPLPDYSGDFSNRAYLMGDLGGNRGEWAQQGITFDLDTYNYLQSVTDGGIDTGTENGAVIDLNLAIDFDRMGVIPGGLLQLQAVSRYGKSVNGLRGTALPVNTNATTPTTSDRDEDVTLYLPVFYYTQFLSEKFALFAGKINTYPQSNEFSGGSGQSQFWNLNLVAPVSPALIIPYSSLAVGSLIMPIPDLAIQLAAGTSEDTSDSSGFDDIDDGKWALLKVSYQFRLAELPGGVINQYGYGWDSDFNKLNSRLDLGPGGLEPTTKDSTWFNSFSIWQYLWVKGDSNQKVNSDNGRQDLEGVGLFFRYQTADDDTNPIDYHVAGGLGAKGLFPTRHNDTMGVAYSKMKLQETRLGNFIGLDDETTLWEIYYNFEITPAIHLSLDAQSVDGLLPNNDKATILGTQLQVRL